MIFSIEIMYEHQPPSWRIVNLAIAKSLLAARSSSRLLFGCCSCGAAAVAAAEQAPLTILHNKFHILKIKFHLVWYQEFHTRASFECSSMHVRKLCPTKFQNKFQDGTIFCCFQASFTSLKRKKNTNNFNEKTVNYDDISLGWTFMLSTLSVIRDYQNTNGTVICIQDAFLISHSKWTM